MEHHFPQSCSHTKVNGPWTPSGCEVFGGDEENLVPDVEFEAHQVDQLFLFLWSNILVTSYIIVKNFPWLVLQDAWHFNKTLQVFTSFDDKNENVLSCKHIWWCMRWRFMIIDLIVFCCIGGFDMTNLSIIWGCICESYFLSLLKGTLRRREKEDILLIR